MKIISATGHRPNKLGGYGDDVFWKLATLARDHLEEHQPELVITGMALGWDQAVAQAASEAQIPFDAYVPCHGQASRWPQESQRRYQHLLEDARSIRFTHDAPYPGPQVMMQRNIDMVNATTHHVMALWDGSDGGTKHCVVYATKNNVDIINLWDKWQKLNEPEED